MLAQALTVVEQDLHRCGHPLSRSTNPAMAGEFDADAEVVCYACAAEQEFHKTNKHLEPGAIVRVHDHGPEDLPAWDPDADADSQDDRSGPPGPGGDTLA